MSFKHLENVLGLKQHDIGNSRVETPLGDIIRNKIPVLHNGISAYVVFNGRLFYMGEDDNNFWPLTEIYNIKQLVDLKVTFDKFLKKINNKPNTTEYLSKKINTLNLDFNDKLIFELKQENTDIYIWVTYPIGNCLRTVDWSWIKDEVCLLNKVIEIHNTSK